MTDFVHLHTRSWFSFLRGASSPERLAQRAAEHGMKGLALTDYMNVGGCVEFQQACRKYGLRSLLGAEVTIGDDILVLLAQDRAGYMNLCEVITSIKLDSKLERSREDLLALLAERSAGLFCLAGGRRSHIRSALIKGERHRAERSLHEYREIYRERFFVELVNHLEEGEHRLVRETSSLAVRLGIPTVGTNAVCYGDNKDYDLYDLLTCIRLIQTVFISHLERPRNGEAYLKRVEELFPFVIDDRMALERSAELAQACNVDLLPERVMPPAALLPDGYDARSYLRHLCEEALEERLPSRQHQEGRSLLEKELATVFELDLEEFFLVVREVVNQAKIRGISCSGRGSAANSLISYLLGITRVNPIEHGLLFERFLHTGRHGTPDIDVDFDSERRAEIIDWVEWRFGVSHTAMTATFVRYGLRNAVRDAAKALGWPLDVINDLGKAVPRSSAASAPAYRSTIEEILGQSPLVDTLIDVVSRLDNCPRHLGQHCGGMMLSREPLARYTPVQISANGTRIGQHDKDAVEGLGIIKFDVLGLRMLATIDEAIELLALHEGVEIDPDALDIEDPEVYRFICTGKTLGLFQIESGGQMNLLARSQPERFRDLIVQVAIFRPGPVQSGMVHPYVRRKHKLEPVEYLHPDLKPILEESLGLILYQEHVLEIAHQFAGMTLKEADQFRRLMSRFRDPMEMDSMRGQFVDGAVARGIPQPIAEKVFSQVRHFVGFGFCKSHAAVFAHIVFISAYLKLKYPAAFMCALMQHRPGMYPQMTLEEEAKRFGVPTLLPDISRSNVRYVLERDREGRLCIRKPLNAIKNVSKEDVQAISLEWLRGEFTSMEDLYRRVRLKRDTLESLARAGVFDSIAGDPRRALWEIGVLANRLGPAGYTEELSLLALPAISEADIPALPEVLLKERVQWDLTTHSSARVHPMTLIRRQLTDWEVRPISTLFAITQDVVRTKRPFIIKTAGLVIMRQRPSTANGTCFIIIEDESGFIQTVVFPTVQEKYRTDLRRGALIVRGELQMSGNWRGLVVSEVWPLERVSGGYTGFPAADGGRDRMEGLEVGEEEERTHREEKERVR